MSSGSDSSSPWSESTANRFEGKDYSKHFDPCQEAANKSIKCLHRNPNQKDLCNDYFQYARDLKDHYIVWDVLLIVINNRAYRDCKKAWIDARKKEKAKDAGWF